MLTKITHCYRFTVKQLLFWFVAWSILGVILAQTEIADAYRGGFNGYPWEPWSWAFSAVYAFALLTPLIVYFCQQWRLEKRQFLPTIGKLLLLYFPITLTFITLMLGLRFLLYWILLDKGYAAGDMTSRYLYEFPKSLPFYFTVVFITYTRIYQQQAQQEQLNAARLQVELLDTKLEVLQHQLQPHFLFNTLNLISSTMYKNVDKADSIITRLADLLRYSLASKQQPFVSLQQELAAMNSYLEIAELRFGERLTTHLDIAPQTLPLMIPVMLLQPLLENAVKYGIEPADKGGTVSLKTAIEEEQLVITIVNALHPQSNKQASFGIGLENTRTRLDYIYAGKYSLTLKNLNEDKMELQIKLPVEQVNESK